jgi:lipoprotein signal peptidase
MNKLTRPTMITFVGGFLFLGDQILKHFARVNPDFAYYIWKPWLGWELFLNDGIAFSLPFPNWLIILITPILLLLLIAWAKEKKRNKLFYFGVALIISGAVSNFVDRVLWGATIDYLRVLTGVINLADVGIVVGALLVVWKAKTLAE